MTHNPSTPVRLAISWLTNAVVLAVVALAVIASITLGLLNGQLPGFIKTGSAVVDEPAWQASKHRPTPMETSLPGIFAAGDVRSGSVKRCAAAVGEGGMAVAGVHLRLAATNNRK